MKTADQRIAHYRARMQSTQIDPVITAIRTQAIQNFGEYANEFVPKQEQLRAVLDGEGLTANKYFAYEAFNMEIYGLWNRISGPSLREEAAILVAKYKAWGCDEDLLKKICTTVWGIQMPAPPP